MSGLTASNLPTVCGVGRLPEKGQYGIDTNILKLQVDGQKETSSLQITRLQAHRGRDVKKKVAESA
jgi:hypothetical protein